MAVACPARSIVMDFKDDDLTITLHEAERLEPSVVVAVIVASPTAML